MKLPDKICKVIGSADENGLLGGMILFPDNEKLNELLRYGYGKFETAVPFAITAFGDILTWEDEKYLVKVSFVDGKTTVLSRGCDYFFEDIEDPSYASRYFDIEALNAAKEKCGDLSEDECYSYVPLPALGGDKRIEHVEKAKFFEYLTIAIQANGKIEC